jgi:predicted ATPase
MDWGYGLLSEPERIVLQRLSVFDDPFTLEGAAAVCGDVGGTATDVTELLGSLLTKSLLMAERGPEPRYRLPDAVRLYGREKLQQSGEASAVQERYQTWSLHAVSHV